jgi:drug/metabolite transporter (DMT)-like permease
MGDQAADRARRRLATGAVAFVLGVVIAVAAGVEAGYAEARQAVSAPWLGLLAVAAGAVAIAGGWLAVRGWRRGGAADLWWVAPAGGGIDPAPAPAPGRRPRSNGWAVALICGGGLMAALYWAAYDRESWRVVPLEDLPFQAAVARGMLAKAMAGLVVFGVGVGLLWRRR